MPEDEVKIQLSRIKSLPEHLPIFPDREISAIVAGFMCLCSGRSQLLGIPQLGFYQELNQFLVDFGFSTQFDANGLFIEGKGIKSAIHPLKTINLPFSHLAQAFWISWIALKTDLPAYIESPFLANNHCEWLKKSPIKFEVQNPNQILIQPFEHYKNQDSWIFKNSEPELRQFALLNSLFTGLNTQTKEPFALKDHLSPLLNLAGLDVNIQKAEHEELDEVQKRLAKLKGIRTEKFFQISVNPKSTLKFFDYCPPKDIPLTAFFTALATVLPNQNINLSNVSQNPSRNGFFSALRKISSQAEYKSRKENHGEIIGEWQVKTSKALVGKKISGKSHIGLEREFSILAIVAAFAEGETILRDFKIPFFESKILELAENLRLSGIEVGIFSDGLVLRGKNEIDGSHFLCGTDPEIILSSLALGLLSHGKSTLKCNSDHSLQEILDHHFPHLLALWS